MTLMAEPGYDTESDMANEPKESAGEDEPFRTKPLRWKSNVTKLREHQQKQAASTLGIFLCTAPLCSKLAIFITFLFKSIRY